MGDISAGAVPEASYLSILAILGLIVMARQASIPLIAAPITN